MIQYREINTSEIIFAFPASILKFKKLFCILLKIFCLFKNFLINIINSYWRITELIKQQY